MSRMSVSKSRNLFGTPNETPLWAWFKEVGESDNSTSHPLQPDQQVFLFTMSGIASLRIGDSEIEVPAGKMVFGSALNFPGFLQCEKDTSVLVVGLGNNLLANLLEPFRPGLQPELRKRLFSPQSPPDQLGGFETPISYSTSLQASLLDSFTNPMVSGPARGFWYEGKIRELISIFCFRSSRQEDEFFCSRQKRLAMERVEKAKQYLDNRFEEPVDLQKIADHLECSSFYISRTFSTVTGTTISQYVRKLRVEKAAELILSGNYSVSEAAVEVGYHSLSHFSKAFRVVKGVLPSKYEAA
ncbi:MAG: hypothetical protein CMO55_13680 [Verrucomicrobiales bacterium]|nr:hypothetical protein [Verrucomicrobiales bacterium]